MTSHLTSTPGDPHAVVSDPKVRGSIPRSSMLLTVESSPSPFGFDDAYISFATQDRDDLQPPRANGQNCRLSLLVGFLLSFSLGYALCALKTHGIVSDKEHGFMDRATSPSILATVVTPEPPLAEDS